MKQLIILFTLLLFIQEVDAQRVGIGTSSPNVNAILDLTSGDKGFLLPRVGMAQRDAMVNPPSGLLFYMNSGDFTDNQIGFYYRHGGQWRRVMSNFDIDKTWQKISGGQYSLLENVGIGVPDPSSPLEIRKDGSFPLLKLYGGLPSLYFYTGSLQGGYSQVGRIYGRGDDLVIGGALGSTDKRIVLQLSGADRVTFEQYGAMKTKGDITFTDDNFVEKGFIHRSGNNLRVGTVGSNAAGEFVVRTNGADHLRVDPSGNLTLGLTGASPTFQLQSSGVDKGFLQLSGSDLRLGTNSDNPTGKFVVRTSGSNQLEIDGTTGSNNMRLYASGVHVGTISALTNNNINIATQNSNGLLILNGELYINSSVNRTGIGTTTPAEKLHIMGNVRIENGKLVKPNTGVYNMMPLCYGRINANGTIHTATPNVSVTRTGPGNYEINCSGIVEGSTLLVTVYGSTRFIGTASYVSSGKMLVNIENIKQVIDDPGGFHGDDDKTFYFIVYNP